MKSSLTHRILAQTLVDATRDKTDKQVQAIVAEFAQFLKAEGRLHEWRKIEEALHAAWKKTYGVSQVTIVSSHTLTKATRTLLEQLAQGADVTERVDERLMGGAIIRIDDKRIDGSIAGALNRLAQVLLQ